MNREGPLAETPHWTGSGTASTNQRCFSRPAPSVTENTDTHTDFPTKIAFKLLFIIQRLYQSEVLRGCLLCTQPFAVCTLSNRQNFFNSSQKLLKVAVEWKKNERSDLPVTHCKTVEVIINVFFLAQFRKNVALLNSELCEVWILHGILSTQTHQDRENPSEMKPPTSAQNWSFGTTNPYE